ncbi:MAG: hemerythrin domain-containing protein [Candidatus Melainabacteria bacterium]|nr:hemerythrin domain-containing protein [Candidatus Melainabacteria bacterium]
MKDFLTKVKKEHEQIYARLDKLLHQLTKVKNERDDEHLLKVASEMLDYIRWLLDEHFKEEEQELFPSLELELRQRLEADHQEIELKYNKVLEAYQSFNPEQDYKQQLLFPAYNLIATINHHAQREDRELFDTAS